MPKQTYYNLSEEKKERIRSSVYHLFTELPYEKVTIRDLANETHMPLGSWYQYFENKSEIYLYHVYEIQKRLTGNMDGNEILSGQPRQNKYIHELTELEQRFVFSIYDAPEDILLQFYFDYLVKGNKHTLMRFFENKKEQGAMDEDIDLDYFTYLVTTANFNLVMYMKINNITDYTTRQEIYKKWHYPIFQAHFTKNNIKDEVKV